MKAVNVDDVLKILHKYGKYIFVTDDKKYSDMVDEIAKIKALEQESVIDKIRAEIKQYQSDYDVHGTEYDRIAWKAFNRCLQIIDKYKAETEDKE